MYTLHAFNRASKATIERLGSSKRNETDLNLIVCDCFAVFVSLPTGVTRSCARAFCDETESDRGYVANSAEMDFDSDEDIMTNRRLARGMLDALCVKQLHGDWDAASKLRHRGLALLHDSTPRFSVPHI